MQQTPLILPKHVAIIMDGNGRWAIRSGLSQQKGHQKGSDAVHESVRFCLENKIQALTLYAFSTENWSRSEKEVEFLMDLLHRFLLQEKNNMIKEGICLNWIGRQNRIPVKTRDLFLEVINQTKQNSKLILSLAIDYGSRDEIIRATQAILQDIIRQKLSLDALNETSFLDYLDTQGLPEIDLLIRTSGEQRLSNFLLYQVAYSEFYFSDELWPDFSYKTFEKAVQAFSKRKRNFGNRK